MKLAKKQRLTILSFVAVLLSIVVLLELAFLFKGIVKINSKVTSKAVNPTAGLQFSNHTADYKYWVKRIGEVGGDMAYGEFKDKYKNENFGMQHTMSHVFGVVLFDTLGLDGVAVCDSTFAFGCYHSFFGKAISVNGVSVITSLDQACLKKWGLEGLGCPHGIGHGVISYLGYDRLLDSLNECSKLSWKQPIGGCTSGAFMEYNYHTMEDPSSVKSRALDAKDPYAPCSSLPDKFLQACYFEQASWWEKVYSRDYQKIGVLCQAINGDMEKDACFRGIGNVAAPSSNYDVPKTIEACSYMPSKSTMVLCRDGASWGFTADPSYTRFAAGICQGLEIADQKECMRRSDKLNI